MPLFHRRHPKNPCPSSEVDNCFVDCVKEAAEKCREVCCKRKYLKLAKKLIDHDLVASKISVIRAESAHNSTDTQFDNIVNGVVNSPQVSSIDPVIRQNTPVDLYAYEAIGLENSVTVLKFTLDQLTNYNPLNQDFTFIAFAPLQYIFGKDISNSSWDTLQNSFVTNANSVTTLPISVPLQVVLKATGDAVGQILRDLKEGITGFVQNTDYQDIPFIKSVNFVDCDIVTRELVGFTGKAAIVGKTVDSGTTQEFYLVVTSRRVF